jgi:hypothetical protein
LFISNSFERWRFKDGVFVDDELGTIDLEKIRAVCNQQCRTRWTAIASRDRLYQFMAMSNEETQKEMRREVSRRTGVERPELPSSSSNNSYPFVVSDKSPKARGTKRCEINIFGMRRADPFQMGTI